MSAIWLPRQGMVSLEGTAVDRAVREYDERLFYAQNTETGYWTVFIRMPRGEDPMPIVAFPYNEEPTVDTVLHKLWTMDAKRHGTKILDQMNAHNARIRAEMDWKASEGAAAVAETAESFMRNDGKLRYSKSFRPLKQTAVKGH